MLDKDQVRRIGAVGVKYNASSSNGVVGIGLFLAVVYRIVGRYISIDLAKPQRVTIIVLFALLALGLKVFMMIENGNKIEMEIGSRQKLKVVYMKFKRHDPKLFRARLVGLVFCLVAVLSCTYDLISETFDVILLLLDCLFFYFLVNLSLVSLTQNSKYQISSD
ncbi:hypothetical protein AUQ39_04865 [Lacticaseibacillus casei]|uniref:DUF443 family protein n=1 Tax=Lacticaseibacillus zeae TaxID=57037 RepID=A0A5R8LXR9_LACZE|nr:MULTISPECIES: DUF443 family protein [Lacticaseibacillus]MDE3283240.1 DUF443 family protein [Lacticaseibacillus casei]OLS09963.1 hypothetical protein AUQ39_04865 [Lacticaseibacillus casei]QVI31400.1 DUF443 family protein [Lacticaseibacillus zeae]TLF42171.1 DUF443 family protein [Lacticaseibacillus zeae]